MQITIMAVGKPLISELRDIARDYENRISQHAQIDWKYIAASPSKNPDICRTHESTSLQKELKPNDTVMLLDERGLQLRNDDLAHTLENLMGRQGRLVIVIGGAFGVNDEIRKRSHATIALSNLVFPHMLIRVILLEQLYRSFMILQGHPYHHV